MTGQDGTFHAALKDTGLRPGEPRHKAGAAADAAPRPRGDIRARERRVRLIVYQYAVLIALVLFFVGFSILLPTTFFTLGNLRTIVSELDPIRGTTGRWI